MVAPAICSILKFTKPLLAGARLFRCAIIIWLLTAAMILMAMATGTMTTMVFVIISQTTVSMITTQIRLIVAALLAWVIFVTSPARLIATAMVGATSTITVEQLPIV